MKELWLKHKGRMSYRPPIKLWESKLRFNLENSIREKNRKDLLVRRTGDLCVQHLPGLPAPLHPVRPAAELPESQCLCVLNMCPWKRWLCAQITQQVQKKESKTNKRAETFVYNEWSRSLVSDLLVTTHTERRTSSDKIRLVMDRGRVNYLVQ